MIVYQGSDKIVDQPHILEASKKADFGQGFYCVASENMAAEWSATYSQYGYVNQYEFTPGRLHVVDLCDGNYTILSWLAVVLKYRNLDMKSTLTLERRDYIVENFFPDISSADVIKGLRADNSNFYIARQFLNNAISLSTLQEAMYQPESNAQMVLKTPKALKKVIFLKADPILWHAYFTSAMERDLSLRQDFLIQKARERVSEEIFITDIVKMKWTKDENKLPPMLYR